MTNPREQAHQLIDLLPETQLSALVGLLETIVDPVAAALRNAPVDDEPESDDERQAVAEARHWLAAHGGKGIPHEEAMRKLGLESPHPRATLEYCVSPRNLDRSR
jgi:hypothetical protein